LFFSLGFTARNHHTAVLQAQREQVKLEKSLHKQQRDLHQLQKELASTKTGIPIITV